MCDPAWVFSNQHRGLMQPGFGDPILDEAGKFTPRHAADDYADIGRRMRNRWIPRDAALNPSATRPAEASAESDRSEA